MIEVSIAGLDLSGPAVFAGAVDLVGMRSFSTNSINALYRANPRLSYYSYNLDHQIDTERSESISLAVGSIG